MMAVHDEVRERIDRHQLAVVARRRGDALASLAELERALVAHARDEERCVIPEYEKRCGPFADNPPELFLAEHAKLVRDLAAIRELLARCAEPLAPTEVIAVIELEQRWKGLFAHHDLREANVLYPRLAARLDADAERAVLAGLTSAD